jgi:AcrR family transcriptional regulator
MTRQKPITTRRERERATIRARIVETALAVLESEGAGALTMRRIATDMEYTAPIVYQHFAGKDALVRELVEYGYRVMVEDLAGEHAEADPHRRLLRAAKDYVRFAGRHPHLYEAMNGTLLDPQQRRAAAEPAYVLLQDLLTAWSKTEGVDIHDGSVACDIVWGILHGMASLGYLATIGNDRAQELASEALRTVLRGWRSEGPMQMVGDDSSGRVA